MKHYLGLDIGSVTTKSVIINENNEVLAIAQFKTRGEPIKAIQKILKELSLKISSDINICGVGTTGSGRQLAGAMVGGDVIKNEITAHAIAALNIVPDVQTIIEIGGQDSKIIILRDGIVTDFAMNTVCAAGTGSFLDQQASRLGIPIEEFSQLALESKKVVNIAGRCTVFAESDMIHKQQIGCSMTDIINGLCKSLVRNYLNNIGKGKEINGPIVFQGGVAANLGIKKAFEEALNVELIIPKHSIVMGALGVAILAKETTQTSFKGFDITDIKFDISSFKCEACSNDCEIVQLSRNNKVIAKFGGRCPKWEM